MNASRYACGVRAEAGRADGGDAAGSGHAAYGATVIGLVNEPASSAAVGTVIHS